jgi:reverse gyrase
VWTTEETEQLTELVEKHFHCLNTSLTRESLELRSQAWDTILQEFNRSKLSSAQRDINELKIKLKNMKAKRTNFKTESDSGNSTVEQAFIEVEQVADEVVKIRRTKPQTSTPVLHNEVAQIRSSRSSGAAPSRYASKVKTYEVILDSLDPINDYSDDDDVS